MFDFTNKNQEKTNNFSFSTSVKAFQDGIELSDGYFVEGDDLGEGQKDLKAGATLEVTDSFLLSNETSIIEVEVSPLFSFDSSEKIEFTIDPALIIPAE